MQENLPTNAPQSKGLSPRAVTVIVILCALYQVWPLDLIPDPIPVAGQLDDLVAFIVAVMTAKSAKRP